MLTSKSFGAAIPLLAGPILRSVPAGPDSHEDVTLARWDLAMLERDYAGAEKVLSDYTLENFGKTGNAPKAILAAPEPKTILTARRQAMFVARIISLITRPFVFET